MNGIDFSSASMGQEPSYCNTARSEWLQKWEIHVNESPYLVLKQIVVHHYGSIIGTFVRVSFWQKGPWQVLMAFSNGILLIMLALCLGTPNARKNAHAQNWHTNIYTCTHRSICPSTIGLAVSCSSGSITQKLHMNMNGFQNLLLILMVFDGRFLGVTARYRLQSSCIANHAEIGLSMCMMCTTKTTITWDGRGVL